ncbi:MAG: RbsD/FucU domain-containing protein, partial [Opitutae bacterium]
LSVAEVLRHILAVHPVEEAVIMDPLRDDPAIAGYPEDWEPPVWQDYRKVFSESDQDQELKKIQKWEYYDYVTTADHVLTVQTGEQEMYANICLATGVRRRD